MARFNTREYLIPEAVEAAVRAVVSDPASVSVDWELCTHRHRKITISVASRDRSRVWGTNKRTYRCLKEMIEILCEARGLTYFLWII